MGNGGGHTRVLQTAQWRSCHLSVQGYYTDGSLDKTRDQKNSRHASRFKLANQSLAASNSRAGPGTVGDLSRYRLPNSDCPI